MSIPTNTVTSCLVRFFLNKSEICERQYECGEVPIIPKRGEIVSLCDNDWLPCEVKDVVYNYPTDNDYTKLIVDIVAEDCEDFEYGMPEEEDNW